MHPQCMKIIAEDISIEHEIGFAVLLSVRQTKIRGDPKPGYVKLNVT